jgi:hypothetical protein
MIYIPAYAAKLQALRCPIETSTTTFVLFVAQIMPPKHLEQVLVEDPNLAEGLTGFGEFLTTSYFYPSGSYEKCEDSRVPQAWATLSKTFAPYIKVSLSYSC